MNPQTTDGIAVPLHLNTGLVLQSASLASEEAHGVGLYRTEFPFMVRDRFPGEEVQERNYRRVLEAFAPRPVNMRTLDIGGDKPLPYFPVKESNPFLGWRGIRISLDHPEIFLTQVRAMLRAGVGFNNLQIMLPMITTVSQVDELLLLIQRAHEHLSPGGRFMLHDFVVEADRTGPKLAALWQLQHTAFTPKARSLDDAWLAQALGSAGFDEVSVQPMIPGMTMLAQGVRAA